MGRALYTQATIDDINLNNIMNKWNIKNIMFVGTRGSRFTTDNPLTMEGIEDRYSRFRGTKVLVGFAETIAN